MSGLSRPGGEGPLYCVPEFTAEQRPATHRYFTQRASPLRNVTQRLGNYMYYVYGLQPIGKPEGPIKIGFSNKPTTRIEALEPGALGERLQMVFQVEAGETSGEALQLERLYHKHFAVCRMNGEWFRFTPEMLTWLPDGTRLTYAETKSPATNTLPALALDVGDATIFSRQRAIGTSPPKELPTAGDLSNAITIQKVVQRN